MFFNNSMSHENSVYYIVFKSNDSMKRTLNDCEYWWYAKKIFFVEFSRKFLKGLGVQSTQIFFIGTHLDQMKPEDVEQLRNMLKDKFPDNSVQFVSSTRGTNVKDVIKHIKHLIEFPPVSFDEVTRSQFKFRSPTIVEEMEISVAVEKIAILCKEYQQIIPFEKYVNLMSLKRGFPSSEDQDRIKSQVESLKLEKILYCEGFLWEKKW